MVNVRTIIVALALALPASAQSLPENKVQECACEGMEQELRTGSGTWVDCVSDTHAIEVEATQDWAEAIGQSLHYAAETGKRAKIFLFCEQSDRSCYKHELTLRSTIAEYSLPIEWEYVPDHCIARLRSPDAANTP